MFNKKAFVVGFVSVTLLCALFFTYQMYTSESSFNYGKVIKSFSLDVIYPRNSQALRNAANSSSADTSGVLPKLRNNSNVILIWAHPWFVNSEGPAEGTKAGPCTITYQRKFLKTADAVVFHYTGSPTSWTQPRDPTQRFVWWNLESPWVVQWFEGKTLKEYNNMFNWTMTYRRSADIYSPYFSMKILWKNLPRGKKFVDDLLAAKKSLAAWFVSECSGKKGARMRMNYINEMMKVLPEVDRYGRCFGNRAKMGWDRATEFVRERKFYFSFENSLHCRDYITEKFFRNGLTWGAVPVVWGTKKEDYLAIAPPNSFIHAEDFDSPQELAKYLLYLDKNNTAYAEYFKWREDPNLTLEDARKIVQRKHPEIKVVNEVLVDFEELCNRVRTDNSYKVIPDLRAEFIENDSPECRSKT